MKRWICLFLVMSSSLAHPNDREHGDFYRGLTGLKAQIDEINRDLILLENGVLRPSPRNRHQNDDGQMNALFVNSSKNCQIIKNRHR